MKKIKYTQEDKQSFEAGGLEVCGDKSCKWYPYRHSKSFHWIPDPKSYYRDGNKK